MPYVERWSTYYVHKGTKIIYEGDDREHAVDLAFAENGRVTEDVYESHLMESDIPVADYRDQHEFMPLHGSGPWAEQCNYGFPEDRCTKTREEHKR